MPAMKELPGYCITKRWNRGQLNTQEGISVWNLTDNYLVFHLWSVAIVISGLWCQIIKVSFTVHDPGHINSHRER